MPNLKFITPNGQKVKIKQFKGKVVYIDIWASWCEPCMRAFPSIASLQKEFEGKPVVVLLVNVDRGKYEWRDARKKLLFKGKHVWDGQNVKILTKLGIKKLPRYLLLDKKGKIYSRKAKGPFSVGEDINKLLKER